MWFLSAIGPMFFANTLGSIFTILMILAVIVAVGGFTTAFISDIMHK